MKMSESYVLLSHLSLHALAAADHEDLRLALWK